MGRINLSKIAARDKDLTEWELQSLYRNNVCNLISEAALKVFRPNELKRHIAVVLYRRNCFTSDNNRVEVITAIANLLFVHPNTVRNWVPSKKTRNRCKKTSTSSTLE